MFLASARSLPALRFAGQVFPCWRQASDFCESRSVGVLISQTSWAYFVSETRHLWDFRPWTRHFEK